MARNPLLKLEFFAQGLDEGTVGIDEVNYSPSMAGDCLVVACWLPLDKQNLIRGIYDSKKLGKESRLYLFEEIQKKGLYSIAPASISDIAEFGIHTARNIAASSALAGLNIRLQKKMNQEITHIFCDKGMGFDPAPKGRIHSSVAADKTSYLVGAASIVAKTYVDMLFEGMEVNWPGFNLNKNHGSGNQEHYAAIRALGPCPAHRVRGYGADWWERIAQEPA